MFLRLNNLVGNFPKIVVFTPFVFIKGKTPTLSEMILATVPNSGIEWSVE